MARYLLMHRSAEDGDDTEQPEMSEEQMKEMYAAFGAWQEKFKDRIEDMGGKLGDTGRVVSGAGVTDGPFAETKEVVGGYMIVSADSYDEAVEVAQGIPGAFGPGSSVEMREITTP